MIETRQQFGTRVNDLKRKNVMMTNGYYTTIRNDGLIVARPVRRGSRFPFKLAIALLVIFFFFKAFVLSAFGPGTYQVRLNTLKQGTIVERAGAWALGLDPVTIAISSKIGPIFRG